jgi:hypothetical protein
VALHLSENVFGAAVARQDFGEEIANLRVDRFSKFSMEIGANSESDSSALTTSVTD